MGRPAKKLTPKRIALIKEQRKLGRTYDDLASEFGVSIGSISNALKVPDARSEIAQVATAPAVEDLDFADLEGEAAGDVDHEDMKRFLVQQINQTKRDMLAVEPSARATMGRTLAQLMTLLARVAPPPPPDPNESPDMIALGEATFERFAKLIDNAAKNQSGPVCPACRRPTFGGFDAP